MLVKTEVMAHCADLHLYQSRGLKNTHLKCDSCSVPLLSKFDRQDIWMTPCEHVFHARCIAKSDGTCRVCFNELDALQSFISLRKRKNNADLDKRTDSLEEDHIEKIKQGVQ